MKLLLIGLPLLIYFTNIVVAKTCQNQERSIECEDNDFCCETNGNLRCCPFSEYWWIWLIIGICTILPCVIIFVVICCVIYCIHKRSRTPGIVQQRRTIGMVQQRRTIDMTPDNGEVNLVKMETYKPPYSSNNESIDNTDAPPSYSDIYNS